MSALLISFIITLLVFCQVGSTIFIVYTDKLYHKMMYKYIEYERGDFWFDIFFSLLWPITVPMYFFGEYLPARRKLKGE